MHILLTTNSLLLQRLWFGPFQFQMCLIRKERDMQPYFVHWTNGCLSNQIRRVSTFVSIRNPFTLLIDLNQYIDNKWLLNSLHHLKISRVFYNDITKKAYAWFLMLDQNLFIFPPKTHVVVMIEIITEIATHTWKLWI